MSLQAAQRAFLDGDYARAIEHAERLLEGDPGHVAARSLRANVRIKQGDLDAAIVDLEILHRQAGDDPRVQRGLATALNARGARRLRAGQLSAARNDLMDALVLLPEHAPALFNLALLQKEQGDERRAVQSLSRLLELSPDDLEARLLLAELELRHDPEAATRWLTPLPARIPEALRFRAARVCARVGMPRRVLQLLEPLPGEAEAMTAALESARDLAANGHLKPARDLGEAVFAASGEGRRAPGLRGLLQSHLTLPPVPEDRRWLLHARHGYERGLIRLHERLDPKRLAAMEPSLEQLVWSNFLLAYQGEDDRALQEHYGRLLERCLTLFRPAWNEAPGGSRGGRRVALVGSCFRECTAGHYFGAWPAILRQAGFHCQVIQLGPRSDAMTEYIGAGCERLQVWQEGLDRLAQTLREAEFDLILYPELGMDMRLLPLAALRLAPRQACAWGHPVTSGLATIDAYISCAAMEPDDAQVHYSERLHLLPGIGTRYRRPQSPQATSRTELGLPADRVLGLFPQSPFKIHPDNDALLAAVAAARSDLTWVMFEGDSTGMTHALRRRMERALRTHGADPERQLAILPLMPRSRYLAVNRCCDFMLDSLHWSGGNTSLDALASGLPILTCAGPFMRGRQSAAMLGLMNMEDQVAESADALRERAIVLAADSGFRRDLRQRIDAHADVLFDRDDTAAALPEVVRAILDA